MNLLEHEKHKLWEGRGVDRLILPKIPNPPSPRSSPRLVRRNTSNDVLMRGTLNNDVTLRGELNHDVTLKVPKNNYQDAKSSSSLVSPTSTSLVQELSSPNRSLVQELKNDITLEVPQLTTNDFSGIIPEISYGSSAPAYSDEPYDSDDDLRVSMTLPRYFHLFVYLFFLIFLNVCMSFVLYVFLYVGVYHGTILLADLGGVPGARPPPRVKILSFRHTKFSKCNHLGSRRPLRGRRPLQEILDPHCIHSV